MDAPAHNAKVNNPNLPKLQQQYYILRSRTNRAAEKARNHWWSTKAAEVEEHMTVAEKNGCVGSLIRKLRITVSPRVVLTDLPACPTNSTEQRNKSLMCSIVKNPWTMTFCCKYSVHHHPQKQKLSPSN